MYGYMCTYMYMYLHVYMYMYRHVYMYMYIHVYMYMYIVCVYKFNFNMPLHVCFTCTLMHFVHRFGPPVRFWCMRFESKHNYFKDLAHRVKCFKNIPKTMAERHQYLLCFYLNSASKGSSFVKETMVGPGRYIHSVYMYTVPGDFMYMYICTCTFIVDLYLHAH